MINRQALNIVANFSGVGARLIFSLVFNIVYFRLLGSESYGLIGFYASLAALSSLFDLGLNQTTVREVARRGADGEARRRIAHGGVHASIPARRHRAVARIAGRPRARDGLRRRGSPPPSLRPMKSRHRLR